jgi:hypothetical protein
MTFLSGLMILSVLEGQKIYMGAEGYIVQIQSITLEPTIQNPHFEAMKGLRMTYKNGNIFPLEREMTEYLRGAGGS